MKRRTSSFRRLARWAARCLAVLVLLSGTSLGYLAVERNRPVSLPAPSGKYPVGRRIVVCTDATRPETLGGPAQAHRALSVWIWYPAERAGVQAPYLPADWKLAVEADQGLGSFLSQPSSAIRCHSSVSPPVSERGPFPLLVFEPGLGPVIAEYTTLAEELASHGYVVVGLNPTYSASVTVLGTSVIRASGRGSIADDAPPQQAKRRGDELADLWATDDRFAIDQAIRMNADATNPFGGKIDVRRIGLLGHSLGGAAALEACREDARCSAAADVDGWPYGSQPSSGIPRPILFLMSEPGDADSTPAGREAEAARQAILARATPGIDVRVRGARHFNFSDLAAEYGPLLRPMGAVGTIDGARGLRIASDYLVGFFDETLRGRRSELLRGPSSRYPETRVTVHGRTGPHITQRPTASGLAGSPQ